MQTSVFSPSLSRTGTRYYVTEIQSNLELVFTALHVMQTRYCEEISVRLSVRLSHA